MSGRSVLVPALFGAATVAAAAALVIGFAKAGADSSEAPGAIPRFDRLSNAGLPVEPVPRRISELLTDSGGQASLRLLGSREGSVFYTAPGATGGTCYASGPASTGGIAVLVCPSPGNPYPVGAFPSRERPILDLSGSLFDADTRASRYLELSGFAADGVAKVGLTDSNRVLHTANVLDNIYHLDFSFPVQASGVVAFDEAGRAIYGPRTLMRQAASQ